MRCMGNVMRCRVLRGVGCYEVYECRVLCGVGCYEV